MIDDGEHNRNIHCSFCNCISAVFDSTCFFNVGDEMFNAIMLREFFANYQDAELIVINTTNNNYYLQTAMISELKVNKYFVKIELKRLFENQTLYIDIEKIESVKVVE